MDICVIGAGYVGLVTSCCLSYLGNSVTCVESDKSRLDKLKSGSTPFFEPGLEEFTRKLTASGNLTFSDGLDLAVKHADVIFIAVGTPSLSNGEPDMSQVMSAARAIGSALDEKRERVIVNKSTVPVGSGNWVEMLVSQGMEAAETVPARAPRNQMPRFAVVSNPEFLREGSAIHDTFYPDRIVVGSSDEWATQVMRNLYEPIVAQTFAEPQFAARPKNFKQVAFVSTDLASAEMIKYSANAFLALKISFANEIAGLCEKVGADIRQVAQGIGLDNRIGKAFLNAGIGWGGSCFKKDVSALIEVAHEYNCPTALLEATVSVNHRQRLIVITKLQEELKILKGRTIGIMGLSFKPDTDDLRDAPSLTIISHLIKMGAQVKVYDPVSNGVCFNHHAQLDITYCHDLLELATHADALVLVTEWKEFLEADWMEMAKVMRRALLIDGRNFLPESALIEAGFTYRGIGH